MSGKLVVHLLATAALRVRNQTSLKTQNGQHILKSGQYTVARQKKIYKIRLVGSMHIS
jgi:hypothetical protein